MKILLVYHKSKYHDNFDGQCKNLFRVRHIKVSRLAIRGVHNDKITEKN